MSVEADLASGKISVCNRVTVLHNQLQRVREMYCEENGEVAAQQHIMFKVPDIPKAITQSGKCNLDIVNNVTSVFAAEEEREEKEQREIELAIALSLADGVEAQNQLKSKAAEEAEKENKAEAPAYSVSYTATDSPCCVYRLLLRVPPSKTA